ncbi:MAG: glycosyltransferase [Nanoarchaeota archaeon]
MKIAIFHNYMDNIGGSEIVALALAKELHGDVYTTNFDLDKIKKVGFEGLNIISIGRVPLNPPLRQQFALYRFKKLNLRKKYDFFIIAGDWALSGAVNNKPNIWYVHSPMRELWDLYEYTRENIVPWYKRPFFDLWIKYNRHLTKKYLGDIDGVLCNSNNTKKRINEYLDREAKVIYPPIDTSKFRYNKNGDYWLSVNRLTNHKRVELQLMAFSNLPDEKLIVVGCYEGAKHFQKYSKYLKKIKPENVKFVKDLDFSELTSLYSNCKGLITTSKNEDFGMNVVEAMASGKPVIAVNEGGYKETVIDGITGKLISADVNELIGAIREVGVNSKAYKQNCINQAKKFDVKNFIKEIKNEIGA